MRCTLILLCLLLAACTANQPPNLTAIAASPVASTPLPSCADLSPQYAAQVADLLRPWDYPFFARLPYWFQKQQFEDVRRRIENVTGADCAAQIMLLQLAAFDRAEESFREYQNRTAAPQEGETIDTETDMAEDLLPLP